MTWAGHADTTHPVSDVACGLAGGSEAAWTRLADRTQDPKRAPHPRYDLYSDRDLRPNHPVVRPTEEVDQTI